MDSSPNSSCWYLYYINRALGFAANEFWLVTGSILNSLSTKGVRCRTYRNADNYLGYQHGNKPAIFYDGDTLMIDILFKTEDKALGFESCILNEQTTFGSPMNNLAINASVSSIPYSTTTLGKRIYFRDYIPTETESPQDTISQITPVFSTYEISSDEFKYQRIENLSVFGQYGKAESCHLISAEHCRKYESYRKFDNDKSNRLAMSRDMHGWYDELSTSVPLFNVKILSNTKAIVFEDRYEIVLSIKALDAESARMVFWRLKEGSKQTNNPLVMNTTVHVVNPDLFEKCLDWKSKQIDKRWREFLDMDPAIP